MLIDTHSHLYDEAFDDDRQGVVQRAVEKGVSKIILPAIDPETHERLLNLNREFPDVFYPLMGLHPTSVNNNQGWMKELEITERLLRETASGSSVKFYGVGEVGMDLYWSSDYAQEQEKAFRKQIELSLEFSLPLVIHTREAWPEMRRILYSYKGENIRGVLHSFSGTLDDYRFFCGFGDFLFGIGGPVTYKKSQLAEIIPFMDMGKLVLETDSPYLPPVPYRGKRNESSYVTYVCDKVAELTGKPPAEVENVTTANAIRMFRLESA